MCSHACLKLQARYTVLGFDHMSHTAYELFLLQTTNIQILNYVSLWVQAFLCICFVVFLFCFVVFFFIFISLYQRKAKRKGITNCVCPVSILAKTPCVTSKPGMICTLFSVISLEYFSWTLHVSRDQWLSSDWPGWNRALTSEVRLALASYRALFCYT